MTALGGCTTYRAATAYAHQTTHPPPTSYQAVIPNMDMVMLEKSRELMRGPPGNLHKL